MHESVNVMESELETSCNDRLLEVEEMDKESITSEPDQDLRWFTSSFILAEVLGIVAIILVITWFAHFHDGFSWTFSADTQFNFHPVLMIFGMIFIYANAIMIYRIFRNERKKRIKYLHGFLHVTVFITTVISLQAVFSSHYWKNIPNMYSAHSWLGLSTVLIFCFQYVAGFISFLFPGLRMNLRAQYLPVHTFVGIGLFLLAVATAMTGIVEKTGFIFSKNNEYVNFPPEGVLVNCLVLVLVFFALIVVFVVVNPNYKRRPLPEEQLPLVSQGQN